MTRDLRPTAILIAIVTAAPLWLVSLAGAGDKAPVVDPYYAARQATQDGQQATSGYDDENVTQPAAYDRSGVLDPEEINSAAPIGEYEPGDAGDGNYDDSTYDSGDYYDGAVGGDGCLDPSGGYLDYGQTGDCHAEYGGYVGPPQPGSLWHDVKACRKFWVNVDYLNWWVKGSSLPPLVTTSQPGTSQSNAGVLDEATTTILYGNQRVNGGSRPGGRIQFGMWLAEGEFLGVDGSYYALGTESSTYSTSSSFNPLEPNARILGRPFFNTLLGRQDAFVLAYPQFQIPPGGPITGFGLPGSFVDLNGSVSVRSTSNVQSATFGLRHLLTIDFIKDQRLFLTGGYRFFKLDESLQINDRIDVVGGFVPRGPFLQSSETFATTNQFHGGYVGLFHEMRHSRISLETHAQLAMGYMREVVTISGNQIAQTAFGTSTAPYSFLLAQPSNIGRHGRDQFALIPEVDFKLGFQLTPWMRATVGYNFTYVSRVFRPGNEVDTVVNPLQVVGLPADPNRPGFRNNPTDLWLQGLTTGVEFRF